MNMNQLRVFHTVATVLSFTRASEELHLTQPGISKHIKELEETYGVRLFDRLGRRVMLTQAGEILYRATVAVFAQLEEARARIDDLKGLAGGMLSIGASVTIAAYILPGMLARFRKEVAAVEIAVDTGFSGQIVDKVLENALELGFVGHYDPDPRLAVQVLMKDFMELIVSPRHPWARRTTPVRLEELAGQTVLLSKRGSGTWRLVSDCLNRAGVVLSRTLELGTTEGVKQAVAADLGVSILSRHVLACDLSGNAVTTVPLAMAMERDLFLVRHKDRYLSQAAQAFLSLSLPPPV
jgi:DNA-binding transcriptional LysR family regulator